jgi:hypothetical protein
MTSSGWGWLRRFGVYAALTLVPVVWLGVVLGRTVTTESDRAGRLEGGELATALAQAAVEPFLHGPPIGEGLSEEERSNLTQSLRNLLANHNVLAFRLRDNDGRIMFDADDPAAPPSAPIVDDEVQDAVAHGIHLTVTRVGTDGVDLRERKVASVPGPLAVEAYVALHARARGSKVVVGVAEVYIDYGPIVAARSASIHRLRCSGWCSAASSPL